MLNKFKALWADSLYRNSFWLMAGSFSMAGIGFFYWMIAARLYTPEQIGLATTFLSAASLINGFAMLGFGTTLIRFLPTSSNKDKKISTAFTIVSVASFLIGGIYLLGLPIWTEKLLFIRSTYLIGLIVLLYFPINTLNGITDSVFVAFRQSHWVFISNVTQSLVKLVSLVMLATLGVWGVIGSNMVAILVATFISIFIIIYRYSIRLKFEIDTVTVSNVKEFALKNYFSGLIGNLPSYLLPIIITSHISPAQTAFFYIPNLIISLLGIIPTALSKSYFTENSQSNNLVTIKKPMLISGIFLLGSILIIVLFGNTILSLFGENYAFAGFNYLLLMSIATFIYIPVYFLSYRQLLLKKTGFILNMQILSTISYLLLSAILIKLGITGIALASIFSNFVVLIFYLNKHNSTKNLDHSI